LEMEGRKPPEKIIEMQIRVFSVPVVGGEAVNIHTID